MLTIIFGAGASFDSDPINSTVGMNPIDRYASRPPLAKDLFDVRYAHIGRNHPHALPLFSRLRRAANIEHELEQISAESSVYSQIPRQLFAIRNYLHDVILNAQRGWSNAILDNSTYIEFLDLVNRWQERTGEEVTLITFNYDTFLDQAITSVLGISFPNLNSYIKNGTPYKLFKPHGSVDWFHLVKGVGVSGNILASASKLVLTDTYYTEREGRPEGHYIPAIAIPTETKTGFEFPLDHLEAMKDAIRQTTLLLTIGWRGAEKHFLQLWKDSNITETQIQKIQIVNTSFEKGLEIGQTLAREGNINSDNILPYPQGFTRYVPVELNTFLKPK